MNLAEEELFTTISKSTETTVNSIYKKEQEILLQFIITRLIVNNKVADVLDGFIYQKLVKTNKDKIKKGIMQYFPNGIIQIQSSSNNNYQNLQTLLMNEKFEEADALTNKYLCELVQKKSPRRKKWLYFTDVQFLSSEDLFTLDNLWKTYSKGKFGFSVQKKIWIKGNKNWDKLWEKISWTNNGKMKRYPQEFQWTIEAPEGHLPLFNQLRGTQTLSYLFQNITWA